VVLLPHPARASAVSTSNTRSARFLDIYLPIGWRLLFGAEGYQSHLKAVKDGLAGRHDNLEWRVARSAVWRPSIVRG
jgi:hypothetical protein